MGVGEVGHHKSPREMSIYLSLSLSLSLSLRQPNAGLEKAMAVGKYQESNLRVPGFNSGIDPALGCRREREREREREIDISLKESCRSSVSARGKKHVRVRKIM